MKLLFLIWIFLFPVKNFAFPLKTTHIQNSDLILENKLNPLRQDIPLKAGAFPTAASKVLLAKNTDTFDPFIDYGEFQDDVTEEESINFFHYGRSISISLAGGYEAVTPTIRQIYGDTGFLAVNASFFLDLRFAIQLSGVFPTGHYNSLFNTPFQFTHYGLDLKYYWNRQYLNKDRDFFSPYVLFGPFHLNTKSPIPPPPQNSTQNPGQNLPRNSLSRLERAAVKSSNSAGVKIGFGFELALIQQSFIGFEISYLYTVLLQENQDLSNQNFPPLAQESRRQNLLQHWQFPKRPEVKGYRFYGDLVNIGLVFGINF